MKHSPIQAAATLPIRVVNKLLRLVGYTIERRASIFEIAIDRASLESRHLTIVDVGANTGQGLIMANKLARRRGLKINCHAFEPMRSTYEQLGNTAKRCTRIETTIHKLGLSDRRDTATIHLANNSLCNSIDNSDYWKTHGIGTETIELAPLEEVLTGDDIPNPALLKIDIEGHELQCLRGMSNLLKARCFNAIIVEAGFDPNDKQHTYFGLIQEFLLQFGYLCAGVEEAEIVPPRWNATPCIGYANTIFVAPQSK